MHVLDVKVVRPVSPFRSASPGAKPAIGAKPKPSGSNLSTTGTPKPNPATVRQHNTPIGLYSKQTLTEITSDKPEVGCRDVFGVNVLHIMI